jgi:hypothetical protein
MAEEQPIVPPPGEPIRDIQAYSIADGYFVERVSLTATEYRVLLPGTEYSTIVGARQEIIDQFGPLYFIKQVRETDSDQWAMRYWGTDAQAQDVENAEVSYLFESVAHPAYARVYNVRRDLFDSTPPIPLGSPLTALIAIKVTDGGGDYTQAEVLIDGTGAGAVAQAVIAGGVITSIVVTKQGIGYTEEPSIEIQGDGGGCVAEGIIQPQTAVLVSQKKVELHTPLMEDRILQTEHALAREFVRVMRVYETLPGPTLISTEVAKDGTVQTAFTTRKVATTIVPGEEIVGGFWDKTSSKETDSKYVAEEIVERRQVPGNTIISTKNAEDGTVITVFTTLKLIGSITSDEALVGGFWDKTSLKEIESDLVAEEVVERRPVPGNAVVSTKVDEDGMSLYRYQTLKVIGDITPNDEILGATWRRTSIERVDSDLVANEVVQTRTIPGNPIISSRVEADGVPTTIAKTLSQTSTLSSSEVLVGQYVVKTFVEPISHLVSWEVVETKFVFPNKSSSTEIKDPVPPEFQGVIPSYRTEVTVTGDIVDPPVLNPGDLEKVEEQISTLLKRRILLTRAGISFPVVFTNKELTEEYGGGLLDVILTLDDSVLTADQGKLVVRSKVIVTGGGALWLKETAKLPALDDWPELDGTDLDEVHLIALPFTKQTVDAGATGGIVGSVYTKVDPLDKWRSVSIATTVPSDLSSLNRDYAGVVRHDFPDTLLSAVLDYADACNAGGCVYDFGIEYDLLRGYSGPCDAHIYEIYTNGPPTSLPTVTKFFPREDRRAVAASSASDTHLFAHVWEFVFPYSLHDTIVVTNTASITLPATTPTGLPVSGTEIVKDIQTERWKYGIYISRVINIIVP